MTISGSSDDRGHAIARSKPWTCYCLARSHWGGWSDVAHKTAYQANNRRLRVAKAVA